MTICLGGKQVLQDFTRIMGLSLIAATTSTSSAGLINPDFETGDYTGWTTYTTPFGTSGNGFSQVVQFDVDGDTNLSFAPEWRVGTIQTGVPAGAGVSQDIVVPLLNNVVLEVDIAAAAGSSNGAAGFFELLFDGNVVDSHDFGSIVGGTVERETLTAVVPSVAPGIYEVALQATRNAAQASFTPRQYFDDFNVLVPEPSTSFLTLLAMASIAALRCRDADLRRT